MVQIKITKVLLNPVIKTEDTLYLDSTMDIDSALLDIFEDEVTPTEDVACLMKKFNLAVSRYNKGKADEVVIYTHPNKGTVLRIIIEIYEKIAKEIGKLC